MLLSGTESWNLPRFFGKKQLIEIYSYHMIDPHQKVALSYQQSVLVRRGREPEASLKIILYDSSVSEGSLVLSRTVPLSKSRIEPDIFYFAVAGGEMYHKGSHGTIELDRGDLKWQLEWEPSEKAFRYLPLRILYKLNMPLLKLVAPNPEIRVTGWLNWGDRAYEFKGVPGYQLHQWGPSYPQKLNFGQVSHFEDHVRTSFEGVSYYFLEKGHQYPTMSQFRIVVSGKEYRINRPWQWRAGLSHAHADRWHFEANMHRVRFMGDVFVDHEQLVGVRFKDTDGSWRYGYRTQNAWLRLQLYRKRRGGWILERELKSWPTMAYEFVSPEALPNTPVKIF